MSLTTGDSDDLLIRECFDLLREGLIGLVVRVLREVSYVVQTQLAIGGFTPGIDKAISAESHRM